MDKLILLAPIISIVLLWVRGFSFTFIYWWIPIMLFIPVYLEVDGPGIPPLTFYLFGFLPFVFRKEIYVSAWKDRHWLDFFPYVFILTIVIAEFTTTGFKSARQLLFLNSLIFLGPYLSMKYIILHKKGEVAVARVFVFVLAIIATYNFYTFRFGFNHFLWFRDFWPDYTPNLRVVIPRWGFFRAQGPFVHPISAGIIFGFGLPMTFWLTKYNKIRPKLNGIFIICLVTCGLLMTMSRGPFLGAFVSISLYLIGQSRHRVKIFVTIGVLMLFFSVPLSFKVAEYLSLERIEATSSEHETILYRKDLIKNYIRVIKESPWVGYGFLNIPYVGDQKSIDNAYILYSLSWGIFNVLSVIGLCLASFPRSVQTGFYQRHRHDLQGDHLGAYGRHRRMYLQHDHGFPGQAGLHHSVPLGRMGIRHDAAQIPRILRPPGCNTLPKRRPALLVSLPQAENGYFIGGQATGWGALTCQSQRVMEPGGKLSS